MDRFYVGQSVAIVNKWQGRETLICVGQIHRTTAYYVWMENEHGNLCKFHADGSAIGASADPLFVDSLIPVSALGTALYNQAINRYAPTV